MTINTHNRALEADAREDTQGGQLCFAGTRIPVRAVVSFAEAAYSPEAIKREYPTLTIEQISAAFEFAKPVVTPPADEVGRADTEQWRDIPEWEGLYAVFDWGRVRGPRGLLSPTNGHGREPYLQAKLCDGPRKQSACVFRLVLGLFVGPQPDGTICKHLNGDTTDNRLANLAYIDPVEAVKLPGESWAPVPDFLGYHVSDLGRFMTKRGLFEREGPSGHGYMDVKMMMGTGKKRTRCLHILVASAFLGPRPPGYVVDHIDRDKLNNRADNLRYVTQTENMRNTERYERRRQTPLAPTNMDTSGQSGGEG